MIQPSPTRKPHSEIVWPRAAEDIQAAINHQVSTGLKTYGTELHTFNGRDAGADAISELADLTCYITQLRMENEWLRARLRWLEDLVETMNQHHCTTTSTSYPESGVKNG